MDAIGFATRPYGQTRWGPSRFGRSRQSAAVASATTAILGIEAHRRSTRVRRRDVRRRDVRRSIRTSPPCPRADAGRRRGNRARALDSKERILVRAWSSASRVVAQTTLEEGAGITLGNSSSDLPRFEPMRQNRRESALSNQHRLPGEDTRHRTLR